MKTLYRLFFLLAIFLSLHAPASAQSVTGEVAGVDAIRKILYLKYSNSDGGTARFAWETHVPGREKLEKASIGDELTLEAEPSSDGSWRIVSVSSHETSGIPPASLKPIEGDPVQLSAAAVAEAAAPRELQSETTDDPDVGAVEIPADPFSEENSGADEQANTGRRPKRDEMPEREPEIVPTLPDALPETVSKSPEPVRAERAAPAPPKLSPAPLAVPAAAAVSEPLDRNRPDAFRTPLNAERDTWNPRPARERRPSTASSMPYFHRGGGVADTDASREAKTNFSPAKERPYPPRARRPRTDEQGELPIFSFIADSINGAARSIEGAFERG